MAQADEDQLSVNTPFGTVAAHGINVVMLLAIIILSWLTYTEHDKRSKEHDEIIKAIATHEKTVVSAVNYNACLAALNIYVVSAKDPTKVILSAMPSELWTCLPRFMGQEQQERRKEQENR